MRTWLLLLFFYLLLAGCKSKSPVPSGILPPQEMKVVMWDMMRADQFLADYVFSRDSSLNRYLESEKYYGKILAIHKVSQEEFKNSFTYYNAHPALMKDLMDSIAVFPDRSVTNKPHEKTDSMRKINAPSVQ